MLTHDLETGHHAYGFAGSNRELLEGVQDAIVSGFAGRSNLAGLRFVGSASLQRPLEEARVVDLDVHVVLERLDWAGFCDALAALSGSLAVALRNRGANLASVAVVRGPYKPPPIERGTRLFVHAMVGDWAQYLRSNALARYSWSKYRAALGSFAIADRAARPPTLQDAIAGRAGLSRRAERIRRGRAQLTRFVCGPGGSVIEEDFESESPAVLHELYTTAVVYGYRHLCRALGVLDEQASNSDLVVSRPEGARDRHGVLDASEAELLARCVRSKSLLRGGDARELDAERLRSLRSAALEFIESVVERFNEP